MKSTGMQMFSRAQQDVPGHRSDGVDSAFPYTLLTAQTETERVLTDTWPSNSA